MEKVRKPGVPHFHLLMLGFSGSDSVFEELKEIASCSKHSDFLSGEGKVTKDRFARLVQAMEQVVMTHTTKIIKMIEVHEDHSYSSGVRGRPQPPKQPLKSLPERRTYKVSSAFFLPRVSLHNS